MEFLYTNNNKKENPSFYGKPMTKYTLIRISKNTNTAYPLVVSNDTQYLKTIERFLFVRFICQTQLKIVNKTKHSRLENSLLNRYSLPIKKTIK